MSLTSQHLFTNRITFFYFTNIKIPNFSPPNPITSRHLTFHIPHHKPQNHHHHHHSLNLKTHHHHHRLKAYESSSTITTTTTNDNDFNFDSLLSIAEFLCLVSSTIVSLGFAVNCAISGSKKTVLDAIVNSRVLVLGVVMLVGGVVVGALIRRRQWRRICRGEGGESVNLLERIEKLEEDLKSSATYIRVLSRQLEKLGIRFRVTRKTLKDPISETAALVQKNSEATQALAVQEDILEKELGEIQKVLLAMQEQQQKQLELILAIGKTGKLWESRQEPSKDHDTIETRNLAEGVKQMETPKTQALGTSTGASNDRA